MAIFELWLGRLDSNQRMSAPKADALPLGDAPTKSILTKQRALFINFSIFFYAIFFINASIFFQKKYNYFAFWTADCVNIELFAN